MRFKHVALGCLSIPAALILIAGAFFLVAVLKGPLPESSPSGYQLDEPVPRSIVRLAPDAGTDVGSPPLEIDDGNVLSVRLDLEEGEFEIAPGAFGGSIQVDADFQKGLYELEPVWSETETGPRFELTFRGGGIVRQLRQLLHEGNTEDPRVRVDLPRGVPMHLSLRVRKCAADVDLSGLSIVTLTYEHAMGASVLLFREPNPITMKVLKIDAKMGDVEIAGLGNASTRELAFNGRMGDFRLDFDGDWRHDIIASVDMTMGSATVRVPRTINLNHDNRYVIFGSINKSRTSSRHDPERDGTAKSLILETSARFGEITLR